MTYTIKEEELKPETRSYLLEHSKELPRIIDIGVGVLSMVNTSRDMDFVKNEIDRLIKCSEEGYNKIHTVALKEVTDFVDKKLNYDNPDSYPKKLGLYLNERLSSTKETLDLQLQGIKEAFGKIEANTSEAEGSMLDRLRKQIIAVESFVNKTFDPDNKLSILGQVEQVMDSVKKDLGDNTRATLAMLEEKIQSTVRFEMAEVTKPIMEALISLRDTVTKQQGVDEAIDAGHRKGFLFEDELFETLQEVAKPFGDVVEKSGVTKEISGGQKGDFLYTISSTGQRVVIEAKDTNLVLKSILDYMKPALEQRGVPFGIVVTKKDSQLPRAVGRFNYYDKIIICCEEDIEIALKFARTLLMMTAVKSEGINIGEFEAKFKRIRDELKNCATIKTNTTNIRKAIEKGTDTIDSLTDTIKLNIDQLLKEMEATIKQ